MKKSQAVVLGLLVTALLAIFFSRSWVRVSSPLGQQLAPETSQPKSQETGVNPRETISPAAIDPPASAALQSVSSATSFSQMLEKFTAARKEFGPWGSHDKRSSFALDLTYGTLQARLLALSNPEEAESFALSIVRDGGADSEKVLFATKILAILLAEGRKQAEETLKALVQGSDKEVVPVALEALLANDKEGKNQSLYWHICSKDFQPAFQCGPLWTDNLTKQGLESRAAQYAALNQDDYYSKEALARLSILESPQCAETLRQLVRGPNRDGRPEGWTLEREDWALHVIQLHPTAETLEVLKERLTRAENGGADLIARGVVLPPPTDLSYPSWADKNYDKFLVAYLQLGGKLNEAETSRLTYFGYLGNPKEKLQALMTVTNK